MEYRIFRKYIIRNWLLRCWWILFQQQNSKINQKTNEHSQNKNEQRQTDEKQLYSFISNVPMIAFIFIRHHSFHIHNIR